MVLNSKDINVSLCNFISDIEIEIEMQGYKILIEKLVICPLSFTKKGLSMIILIQIISSNNPHVNLLTVNTKKAGPLWSHVEYSISNICT